ncbi:polysaccharide deacetylase family protein [Streptomyces sp. FT05W]|uniref:Polysaccharide deacetylase family protein n=2 Tax=Bacteria TaxID=2 RepID=A0ABZ1K1N9_9ACTN|nr:MULTISPECIES: polysaccharide deacetylase family protein [Streptomyces]PWS52781.1 polysaccharide deacetylase family protein [Streptomyces sp. FT05W]WSZ46324.1 polysaccharide deacetylase family protein [[Kitasatospora] papulosa]
MAADTSPPRARTLPVRSRPWILTYHSVSDPTDDPYGITVSADRLDEQLTWLRRRGLTGVGTAALLRARAAGKRGLVGLTFDDGYADFLDEALPVLLAHGCTATVFVLPGRPGGSNDWDPLGPRRPLLTEEGVRTVAAAGMEIGSHGLLHRDLTELSDDELRRETHGSREELRRVTGRAPSGFCYPYGIADRRVAESVREAGYAYGCALVPGALAGPLALPRTHVSHADRGARLRAKEVRHRLRYRSAGNAHRGEAG